MSGKSHPDRPLGTPPSVTNSLPLAWPSEINKLNLSAQVPEEACEARGGKAGLWLQEGLSPQHCAADQRGQSYHMTC